VALLGYDTPMLQSKLFTKTRHEAPKDEVSKNAQLLIRAGYVHKEMAGVYSYLPLGLRVLSKIENIVREEMNRIGGQETRMATLHPSEPWKQTGAWDAVDVLFKIQSRTEKEYAMGQSEEEIVTPIAQEYVTSYKDLPVAIYQIGQKYRDELRAKSGIMRGREFGMKDMYSFHVDQADFEKFYEIAKTAYLRIFERTGLTAKVTEGSGGAFTTKISYEFMVLTDAGEDNVLYCEKCNYCINTEIAKIKKGDTCPKCTVSALNEGVASEVGNVFDLGDKYPQAFNFTYKDAEGNEKHPIVGCYGIGTTRLMGVVAERFADDKGLVWPAAVAPFRVHILALGAKEEVKTKAEELLVEFEKRGIEVLLDDRDVSAGTKFADSDLIGIPTRVVVSEKSLAAGGYEMKDRATGHTEIMNSGGLLNYVR
jgi:prolyl-tRNA synthetase